MTSELDRASTPASRVATDPQENAPDASLDVEMSPAAAGLRRRLLEWNTRESSRGNYDYLLTDEPLTRKQAAHLINAGLWATFSGWEHSDAAAANAAVTALEAARPGIFAREGAK